MSEIDLSGDMRPVRVSAGEVVYPPGGTLGTRWQHDIELVLVHRGSAHIVVDDRAPVTLGPNSVGLLLPGHRELFEFGRQEETHHSWVQVGVAGPPPEEIAMAAPVLPASAAVTQLVRDAAAAATPGIAGRVSRAAEHLSASLAVAAIWRYVADAESGREAAGPVDRALRDVDGRLADPDLDLAGLAAAAHVTPAHLIRRFRAELGVTPMAYLWRRRVAAGIDLLRNTGLPVGEVARRSGFRSVYHFSRRVKEETGFAPTELRRQSWSQPAPRR